MSRAALAVRQAAAPTTAKPVTLQRSCTCEATGETCSRCADKRGRLQRLAAGAAPLALPAAVGDVLRGAGQQLPAASRARMEAGFGHDFSDVRIHADASARSSAAAVNARAYTVGNHVVLGRSAPELSTTAGQRLLGHELAHVVQQSRGSVSAGIDPDPRLEREADRAGSEISSGHAVSVRSAAPVSLQREAEDETTHHPTMERIAAEIGQVLGLGEGSSRVVAASLEGGLTGFSHQWNEGGTGARLGKSFKAFSIWDVPDVLKGYLVGAVEGIASPVTDLFSIGVMVEQLTGFINNLASSAISRAAELAQDLRGIVGALGGAFGPIKQFFKDIVGKGREGVKMLADLFNGNGGNLIERVVKLARSVGRSQGEGVAKSLESPWEVKKQQEEEAGGALGKFSQWVGSGRDALIKSPWSKVGNKAGYALGFALIQVVMLVFSDGIGNIILRGGKALSGLAEAGTLLGRTIESAAKFASTAGTIIAKVEEGVQAAVSFILKPLKPVLEPLMKPIAEVMERLGGFLRKLLGIAEKDATQLATTAATKTLGGTHPPDHLSGTPPAHPHAAGPAPHPDAHPTVKPQTHPNTQAPDPHAGAATNDPHPSTAPQAQPHANEKPPPHPASDAAHKPLTDPEPVGGGHHTQMTPEGFELCSPPPCPNLRLIYKEQLAADDALRAEMETLEAKRRLVAKLEAEGRPDPDLAKRVNKQAAKLQQKLEGAGVGKPGAAKGLAPKPVAPAAPVSGSAKPGPGQALVASSKQQMRRKAQQIIAADPDHPLEFLLDKRGRFRPQRGLKHFELADRPDLVQMGHIRSDKLGGDEYLMIQGAWENQYSAVTIEHSYLGGAVLDQPAVSIGGIAVDLKTAQYWENVGLLKRGTVAGSPTIRLPLSGGVK